MAILFSNAGGNQEGWLDALSEYLPHIPVHVFPLSLIHISEPTRPY